MLARIGVVVAALFVAVLAVLILGGSPAQAAPSCAQAKATVTPGKASVDGGPTPTNTAIPTVTPCAIEFVDVPADNPFYASVKCLACRSIISGRDANGQLTFNPFDGVTRGQVAKIVANAAGDFHSIPSDRQTFADVAPGDPYWLFAERSVSLRVLNGYTCGIAPAGPCGDGNKPYFLPNNLVTRGQLAKIVSNSLRLNAAVVGQRFEDVPSSDPFYPFIERIAARGIIGGYGCGSDPGGPCGGESKPYFLPYNGVTRGQTAKIVSRGFFPDCGQ